MSQEFLKDDGQLRVFIVPVDILDVPGLTTSEKLVYIVLRSYVNPTSPTAFPAYQTIADKASLTRRRVIDIIKSLEEKGLIRKETRFTVTKNRKIRDTSNIYTLITPKKNNKGEIISPTPVKSFHSLGEMISPENNHLNKSIKYMNDCMNINGTSNKTNTTKESTTENSQKELKKEIMDALHTYVPKHCYANNIPLGQTYIADIYFMLLKQFQYRLSAEIVRMAAERYFDRACEILSSGVVVNKFNVKNPVGLFYECYKEAIQLYKVQQHKLTN